MNVTTNDGFNGRGAPGGPPNITTEIRTVTPREAAAWLALRPERQRRRNSVHVRRLAAEMSAGAWRLNGEAIKFDSEGHLVDGQHRLAACAAADVCFETLVIHGVDPSTFAVMDQGRLRVARDLFGGTNAAAVESIARIRIFRERAGSYSASMFTGGGSLGGVATRDLLAHMEEHEEVIRWGMTQGYKVHEVFRRRAIYGALIIDMSAIDAAAADDFTDRLASGADLSRGDPLLALRDRLIKWTGAMIQGHPTPTGDAHAAALIRAWNAHARGEHMLVISGHVRPGARFPQITRIGKGRWASGKSADRPENDLLAAAG